MALGVNMIDLDLVEKYLKCKDFDGLSSFLDEIEDNAFLIKELLLVYYHWLDMHPFNI